MKNFVQEGEVMDYVAGADIASGDVVDFPGIGIGVAAKDIANGATGPVAMCGVFKLPKAVGAISQGVRVYWNGTAITTTASTNTLAGYAFKAALSGDAYAYVKLVQLGDTEPGNLSQAAVVAALGTTSKLVGVDGTGSNAAPLVGTEARLDAIEAKIDATLASLKAAGLMATS